MQEPNMLTVFLDRIELLAVRNAETSRRNVDLMQECNKWRNELTATKEQLRQATVAREQAERITTAGDFKMAGLRVDLKEAERERDELKKAVLNLMAVQPGRRLSKTMRDAAENIVRRIIWEIDMREIPF